MKRNLARSLRRKLARQDIRKHLPPGAPAQEPRSQTPKIPLKRNIKLATLNVRGLNKTAKRKELELYMIEHSIDIMVVQETHLGEDIRETRKKHTWHFSGGEVAGTIHHGVGTIYHNNLRHFHRDTECISDRLMVTTFNGKIDLHIISAYAPTAIATEEDKDAFYTSLTEEIHKRRKQGMTLMGADLNAKFNEK